MAIDSQLLQQASNPNTPPEQLRELATCEDVAIRQLIVANPNTPTEVLWELGKEFPEQLLENPVLPLLCLENLNLVNVIPIDTLICLFELETVPDYLQHGLLKASVDLREVLVENSNVSVSILVLLAEDPEKEVRREIAKKTNTPVHLLELLAQDTDVWVREAIAENPNNPSALP
ncbi:hypothetical protein QM565_08615 [Geitlerinema splendidum]|nr:hypothetical protein [Geitlerinema splendidum]